MNKQKVEKLEAQAYNVSRATLRTEDLVVAFYQELEKLNPEGARKLVGEGEYSDVLRECDELQQVVCGEWSSNEAHENACWLLEELVDKLQDEAPKGLYFGVSEGDGTDFGFHVDQEEYSPEETTSNVCTSCGKRWAPSPTEIREAREDLDETYGHSEGPATDEEALNVIAFCPDCC